MISGNDGGATITFDGGETWSSIMNQPTAQFYRVTTDNQVPFRIYGGQQDNTTVAIASQSRYGGIGVADYHDVGGGESAHIAFDPDNPRLIYATSINGELTEYDQETELKRTIIPYPEMMFGMDSKDLRYRANWNAPVAVSPHDPSVIYFGAQFVLKSTDRGANWTAISPDLTRNDPEKQGRNGGPLTPENVGAEFYNTIFYIVESPHEKGTIWVGSDDGLVHLTRDGGANWQNVSPPHKGEHSNEAYINAIEISPHDPGTAYLAVTGFKLNDFSPYIYKTTDYGKCWKRIDEGLPEDTFVRVVREDPAHRGPALRRHRGRHVRLLQRWRGLAIAATEPAAGADHRPRACATTPWWRPPRGAPSGCWTTCSWCARRPTASAGKVCSCSSRAPSQ